MKNVLAAVVVSLMFGSTWTLSAAEPAASFDALRTEYARDIQPLVKAFCLKCHSTDTQEGDLDLERFASLAAVRNDPRAWQSVATMLGAGEMPPRDSQQLSPQQRQQLAEWVRRYLHAEALASAGDPGPVVLRRLNNAEYTYTLQDLTGTHLQPAREFPIDNAAGEGFTNTGGALVMSPGMVQKYLDAAQDVARHAVLLPTGFRFSESELRRDWTNEILHDIHMIYARHTGELGDASQLNRWNADPMKLTAGDGRVDLSAYFTALIRHRERLIQDPATAQEVAREEQLNAKYLQRLAELLSSQDASLLLNAVRDRLLAASSPEEGKRLAADVRTWQEQLFKRNTVGHFGSIRPWLAPVDPVADKVRLAQAIPADLGGREVRLWLSAQTIGEQQAGAVALWRSPRLEYKDRAPILLREVRPLAESITRQQRRELARTADYLAAVAALRASKRSVDEIAAAHKLNVELLTHWTTYLQLGVAVDRTIAGHLSKKLVAVDGHAEINGWGEAATPCLFANRSDKAISFSTLTVPAHGVTVHPSPTQHAVIAWQSPVEARLQVSGKVADTDDKCGNGAAWSLELRRASGHSILASGAIDNGRDASFSPQTVLPVQKGDVLSLVIQARDKDHTCDTTHVELTIREAQENGRTWNLAQDVAGDILAGNPHADSLGNAAVWHFHTLNANAKPDEAPPLPPGSKLAAWKQALLRDAPREELAKLAAAIQADVTPTTNELIGDDQAVVEALTRWDGPLQWLARAAKGTAPDEREAEQPVADAPAIGVDPRRFGKLPDGSAIEAADLAADASEALEIRLPAALARGGEFVVDGSLAPSTPGATGVHFQLTAGDAPPKMAPAELALPVVTNPDSPAREKLLAAYADFRELFPAAMCYARIVPVDEGVTLVLFHREDEHLCRLMLSDEEHAALDRLWDELRYVTADALTSETVLEQLLAFASQDGDPKLFEPLQAPFHQRAERYRAWLKETEPIQVTALVDFAGRAYRRPLTERETTSLRAFYQRLRDQDRSHEEAFRLTLARILTSPAFLYRLEQPVAGNRPGRISDGELASRLSYFLWSTLPDAELRALAERGELQRDDVLRVQVKRMLADDRARRLAIEFACQWAHVRDFDQFAEKSERHFPTFAGVQGDMYEESIRFFTDLFQQDRSLLSILNADYTFLNARLAAHYGVPGVQGDAWRRVDGVRKFGRGGLLTQGTFLARQSGASRTSPILRGNWVSETLLGKRLPRPPKNVPLLPDEVPAGLSERQLIERHSSDPACVKCHALVDPFGFSLENYDAIGRYRDRDAGAHPIDTKSTLPDGTVLEGVDGLRNYLVTTYGDVIVRNLCRKLLGYALGRSVQLSDEPLLEEMLENLAANDNRVSVAVEAIVLSDQFRNIRGREQSSEVRVTPADE